MKISDDMSIPVAVDASDVNDQSHEGKIVSSVAVTKVEISTTDTPPIKAASSSVGTISTNTFVVKLKPTPGSDTNGDNNPHRKTNLLEIFSHNKNAKNVSGVKTLGRIVINRTLLKPSKNKPATPAIPVTHRKNGMDDNANGVTAKAAPIMLRGFPEGTLNHEKKDDEISGNLANFMNFKLAGLVPPPMKTPFNSGNTFQVKLNTPEIKLSHGYKNGINSMKPKAISSPKPPRLPVQLVKHGDTSNVDDELTSLSWLTGNDKNLLRTIRSCNPDDAGISLSGDESEEDEEEPEIKSNAIFTAKSRVDAGNQGGFSTRQYGQTSYNPNGKPPYSFSCLIFMAVEDSPAKMLPVKKIYEWVCKHFPFFQTAPPGWKNSIRHNLSLNKCFKKVDLDKDNEPGKGSLWCIDPAYRPNLIQALKRTPFYPYLYSNGIGQPLSLHNLANLLPGVRAGRVPLWSPSLTQPSESTCTDPDVASAAMNLIELMKGNDSIDRKSADSVQSTLNELTAEIFNRNQDDAVGKIPLVISDPADDHTYTVQLSSKTKPEADDERCPTPESEKSAPDAAYEFETCGTDLESDDTLSIRSDEEEECDLADSGFQNLKRREKSRAKRKRKPTRSPSPAPKRKKRTKLASKNSTKSTQTPATRGLRIKFQKNKDKLASKKTSRKRKITPLEGDGAQTSDVDSGKDSPKVVRKTRKRTPARKLITLPKVTKKANIAKPPPTSSHTSPYGTRSSSRKTRQSRRDLTGNVLERASARKRKQDSVSIDTEDDEEIKLAAGSLLHLAGIRSPIRNQI